MVIKKFAMALLCIKLIATGAICSAAPGDKPEVTRDFKELAKLSHQPCPTASCYLKQAKDANAPFSLDRTFKTESGRSVHVAIRERACKSKECKPIHLGMWGTDGDTPRFVTDNLTVDIDNAPHEEISVRAVARYFAALRIRASSALNNFTFA